MATAEERFRAKVDRRGSHDLWTGFIDDRGVGMVRINGKLRTVQRAAWEFAHGPLPHDTRVNACPEQRACVRLDHLSLAGRPHDELRRPTPPQRRARGTGSKRQLRPGVWQLTITEATTASGKPIRRYQTVRGDAADAEAALDTLATDVRRDLGDLRVRELVGRYLYANHDPASAAFDRDHAVLHQFIEPAYGDRRAASLDDIDVEAALSRVYRDHGPDVTRQALGLTRDTYRWARHQNWTDLDPTRELTLRAFR